MPVKTNFLLATLSALLMSCDGFQKSIEAEAMRTECLESLASQALANPTTYPIAANYAGPLGLVPSSEPDAPAYITKQIQIGTPGLEMRFFAVDRQEWAKAVLIRLTPTERGPRATMFVIDRNGVPTSAGYIERGEMVILSILRPSVQAEILNEMTVWIQNGTSESCRNLSRRLRLSGSKDE